MKITEIDKMIQSVTFAEEIFINLQELYQLLKTGFKIELEECLIIPYYIQDHKRMELYQYEFCCTEKLDFEGYILKLTGKKKIGDVSEEIINLRRKCFSTCDEPNRLIDFLNFLLNNKAVKEEIEQAFENYAIENLYVAVY